MSYTTNGIVDNVIFKDQLENYFCKNRINLSQNNFGNYFNPDSEMIKFIGVDNMNIADDYFQNEIIHSFRNVRFKVVNESISWVKLQLGLDENGKLINISNKLTSYFTLHNYSPYFKYSIFNLMNDLRNNFSEPTIVEEEVFLFFDCFPYASQHNLDDIYNLLYQYKTNGETCKLLVLKSDNFFYNQTLLSLKKHFDLQYFYLDIGKNYHFEKIKFARPYHWIQNRPLDFIKKNYIKAILEEHKGQKCYDNIYFLKTKQGVNCSNVDTFEMTDSFLKLMKEKSFFSANSLIDDLEYKIYVVNSSKNIIINMESTFLINIYKHCFDTTNKNFLILNGGNTTTENMLKHFQQIGQNKYNCYGLEINGTVLERKISLDDLIHHINF